MPSFLDSLSTGLSQCDVAGKHVLVALSGGADSVALLLGLRELREEFQLQLTAGHLNHQLRDEESDADAQWVLELCTRLEIPCVIERRNVAGVQAIVGGTLEETARKVRYVFLEETAKRRACTEIATAHTADDQAETVLHHVVRGTGLAGLRGIPREREMSAELRLIRPLLTVRREMIEAWLREQDQSYRQDASNHDPSFTRNRIRHQLLPSLEQNFNPQVIPALLRLQQQAAETEAVLDYLAGEELQAALVEQSPLHCRLSCEPLARRPPAFLRTCFTVLWRQQSWPRQRMNFDHWNRLAELVHQPRGTLTLPHGLSAHRREDALIVEWNPK